MGRAAVESQKGAEDRREKAKPDTTYGKNLIKIVFGFNPTDLQQHQ